MSGEDLTASRVRRMLPSVSEVLKELTARAPIEPEIAFRAAREICAEELKRIRDAGGESIPLEDLVQRAFLRATGADANTPPAPAPPSPFVAPPPPIPGPVAHAPVPEAPQDVEDPFSETTGAMDLRWDRDAREPFTESAVPGAPLTSGLPEAFQPTEVVPPISFAVETEPYREERPEMPVPFALPAEDAQGSTGQEPAPASMVDAMMEPEPEPEPAMPAFSTIEGGAQDGPGNETLARLSREAKAIDLNAVFPKGPVPGAVPFALPPTEPEESRAESQEPKPFEDDEDTVLTIPRTGRSGRREDGGGLRVGLVLGIVAGLVALAGLGYLLVGLWVERDATPPPVAEATSSPVPGPAGPFVGVAGGSEAPAASPVVEGAVPATTEPAVPSAPADPTGTGAAAGGAVFATPSPSPASAVVPTVVPVPVARIAPTPVQGVAPAPAPVSTAPIPPASAAARQSRDGLVVTKDRAGQPQVFSIHFTSYRDRASAERDLKRVQGLVGREGYVAEVDLGEKGVWQRVMIGAFATAQDAKAVREELVAKGTRDMGWVYRVVGPEGSQRR
ncbi:MAG: SPOR domain-containing protein [Holophagales bacterium]|nr:SPOR domain-containing protein [Holophagales bacterium]